MAAEAILMINRLKSSSPTLVESRTSNEENKSTNPKTYNNIERVNVNMFFSLFVAPVTASATIRRTSGLGSINRRTALGRPGG